MSSTRTIVTAPHPALRTVAQSVTEIDNRLTRLLKELVATLEHATKPRGVGLAAPQINRDLRVFVTLLPQATGRLKAHAYINPQILDHSDEVILGEKPGDQESRDEGCLSLPGLYGPVPRWPEIVLEYQVLEENQLVARRNSFANFEARVIQHELDHLNGILFTDYALKNDLPVFQELKPGSYVEIDKRLLEHL